MESAGTQLWATTDTAKPAWTDAWMADMLLFIAGMAFCHFFVFKTVFSLIAELAPKSISVAPDIEQYFNFVIGMFLAFGITFETCSRACGTR